MPTISPNSQTTNITNLAEAPSDAGHLESSSSLLLSTVRAMNTPNNEALLPQIRETTHLPAATAFLPNIDVDNCLQSLGTYLHEGENILESSLDLTHVDNFIQCMEEDSLEGNLDILKDLISLGEDENRAEKKGTTPLYVEAEEDDFVMINALVELGKKMGRADRHLVETKAATLLAAAEKGHLDIVKSLSL